MKCYEIDYEYGVATIWVPDDADPKRCFSRMANDMFGIRKSIGRVSAPMPDSKPLPDGLAPYAMALSHGGDLATFTEDGKKILDEFGCVYGVEEDRLRGAVQITGRTDYEKIAAELLAATAGAPA